METGEDAIVKEEEEEGEKQPSCLNIEPKYEEFNQDFDFNYEKHKKFFDELFFNQSRLFKM